MTEARRNSAAFHQARGEALYEQRRIAAAARHLERAVALGSNPHETIERCWMCAMLRGDFERAWRISDEVLRQRVGSSCADLPHHRRWVWDGMPLAGRRILIRCYHGLGDAIQFIRFADALAAIAPSVAVEAPPVLIPLLRSAPGVASLTPLDAPTPPYDVEIEAMEIAHALRLVPAMLPAAPIPYLAVPPAARAAARRRVPKRPDRFRIGIVWAAGAWRPERSVPLRALAPLAALPKVELISLQQGPARREAAETTWFAGAVDAMGNIVETAALMTTLDLVISVDTMAAHLAGALARPVWTLLHFHSDWRWMLARADSPWYPTMRLFRQPAPGAWEPVVQSLVRALAGRRLREAGTVRDREADARSRGFPPAAGRARTSPAS